jgi:hypothetical protein
VRRVCRPDFLLLRQEPRWASRFRIFIREHIGRLLEALQSHESMYLPGHVPPIWCVVSHDFAPSLGWKTVPWGGQPGPGRVEDESGGPLRGRLVTGPAKVGIVRSRPWDQSRSQHIRLRCGQITPWAPHRQLTLVCAPLVVQ